MNIVMANGALLGLEALFSIHLRRCFQTMSVQVEGCCGGVSKDTKGSDHISVSQEGVAAIRDQGA